MCEEGGDSLVCHEPVENYNLTCVAGVCEVPHEGPVWSTSTLGPLHVQNIASSLVYESGRRRSVRDVPPLESRVHPDAELLISMLPRNSDVTHFAQIAALLPYSMNPFVECDHSCVVPLCVFKAWLRDIGFTG